MRSARRTPSVGQRSGPRGATRAATHGPAHLTWLDLGLAVAIAAVTIVAYSSVGGLGFLQWDDNLYVTANPHVARGLTWPGLAWALTAGHASNWHPLTWWSHMLDVQWFGMNPAGHHAMNLLLHVASAVALFVVLRRLRGTRGRSAFVAALFAVHPMHVESVAWVAERKDVLSGLLWMLTLLAYVEYARRPRVARYLAVVALFALGLTAKPMLVTLPFVLLLLDVWPLGRASSGEGPVTWAGLRGALPRLVVEKVPMFALAAASSVVTYWAQRGSGSVAGGDWVSPMTRYLNPLVSYVAYIGKLLAPVNLSPYYPYPESIPIWQAIAATVVLAAITWIVLRQLRRRPYLTVGWLWYVGTLVPVIGWVQVGHQAMADRYTYLPYVGLFLMGSWLAGESLRGRRQSLALAGVGVAIVAACAWASWVQVQYWRDGIRLWTRALAVTSGNYFAHVNLGVELGHRGRGAEAIPHYVRALELNPDFALAHNNLGVTLIDLGRSKEAIAHFQSALRIAPGYSAAHRNLGRALAAGGRLDDALEQFRLSLDGGFDDALGHVELGIVLARLGRVDEAIDHYQAALRLRPDHAVAHNNLGTALEGRGQADDAMRHYAAAVRVDPNYAAAHANLGAALLRAGRNRAAIPHLSEALRLQPGQANLHNDLGVALAGEGRVREAVPHFAEAVRLRPDYAKARENLAKAQTLMRPRPR